VTSEASRIAFVVVIDFSLSRLVRAVVGLL